MSVPLLSTKLYLPASPVTLVRRSRLSARLDDLLRPDHKLALISAPPGFGKTCLVSTWIQEHKIPTAWVSLDGSDNEPARFLSYVGTALDSVFAGVGSGALPLLQSPQPPALETVLSLFINELSGLPQIFLLVLDDYHEIQSRSVHDLLAFLLRHLPPRMRLVITSRADPPLPLSQFRARGELIELRANDLYFTADEAARFLNNAMGLSLTPDQSAALNTRTEGWIAGLQLAALSIHEREDIAAFIQHFTGSHRFVLDYLLEQVLLRQTPEVQEFLLQSSILERLTASLCDALTERRDSGALLRKLEERNLFLNPLDDERVWYQYHQLFADMLRALLHQTQPGALPILHRRASEWFEQNAFIPEAIHHALGAKDYDRAASLIQQHDERLLGSGNSMTLRRWLDDLPRHILRTQPMFLLAHAWTSYQAEPYHVQLIEGTLREAEAALAAPSPTLTRTELEEQFGIFAAIHSSLSNNLDDVAGARAWAVQALEHLPSTSTFWRVIAVVNLGAAHESAGEMSESAERYAEGSTLALDTGHLFLALAATWHLGRVRLIQGKLRSVKRVAGDALELAGRAALSNLPILGQLYLGLGRLNYQWNELSAAEQNLHQSLEQVRLWDRPWVLVHAYALLGRLKQMQGDAEAAKDWFSRAEAVAGAIRLPWSFPRVGAYRAQMWLLQGDVARAAQRLRDDGVDPGDELTYLREVDHITLARVLLAQDRSEEALDLLRRLEQAAERGGRYAHVIEILVLRTLAFDALHRASEAISTLERALTLAEPEGFVRVFVDEGAPMRNLLERWNPVPAQDPRARHLTEYTGKLLTAFSKTIQTASLPPVPFAYPLLVEPPSARELEVLRLLARGASNQEIANSLVIAVTTVKKHVGNIYGKLGVETRTQAIARARELNLV